MLEEIAHLCDAHFKPYDPAFSPHNSNLFVYTHTHTRIYTYTWPSLVANTVKNPPAMQETWVQSLGREDPLEKRMATHSSILAWRIPWTEEPSGLRSMGLQRVEI